MCNYIGFQIYAADQNDEIYGKYTKSIDITIKKTAKKYCNMIVEGFAEQLDEFIKSGQIVPFGYFLAHVPSGSPLCDYKTNITCRSTIREIVRSYKGVEEDDDDSNHQYDTDEDSTDIDSTDIDSGDDDFEDTDNSSKFEYTIPAAGRNDNIVVSKKTSTNCNDNKLVVADDEDENVAECEK